MNVHCNMHFLVSCCAIIAIISEQAWVRAQLEDCPYLPDSLSSPGYSDQYEYWLLCQVTDDKYCPAGYYCPAYNQEQVESLSYYLDRSSCTYGAAAFNATRNQNLVICPCTPGQFCPENTRQPLNCIEGYYCPANGTVTKDAWGNEIDQNTGYGAWGTISKICPEGKWCVANQIVPFPCDLLETCPEGTSAKPSDADFIIMAIFIFFAYVFYEFLAWKHKKTVQVCFFCFFKFINLFIYLFIN